MAVTGWRTCGTVAEALFAGGDVSGWSPLTASYLSANDEDRISISIGSSGISYLLKCTNFGFSADISGSDTINGIEMEITGSVDSGGAGAFSDASAPVLLIAGSPSGTAKPTADWSITPSTVLYPSSGASTDKWGTSITASQLIATTFGVGFRFARNGSASRAMRANFVRIRVYYTAGVGGNNRKNILII